MIGGGNQQNSTTRLSNILDGTSQTAAFSERVKGITTAGEPDPLRPTSQVMVAPDPAPDDTSPEPFHKICLAHSPTSPGAMRLFGDPSGNSWFEGYSFCTRYNHVMLPDTWGCTIDSFPAHLRLRGVASLQPSSRRRERPLRRRLSTLIKDGIADSVWWALGTKAGGEIVSRDAF